MSTPVHLLIVFLVAVAFIVLTTSRFKWQPFIVLKLLGNRFPGLAMSLTGYRIRRGVQKQNSTALSSAMRGTLEVDACTRSELMGFLRRD